MIDFPRNELTKTTDYKSNEAVYQYDLRGNLTKRGAVEYYWDSADHMTKVVNGSVTVEYKYDLMGRKVARRKTVSGQNPEPWRWYFYDGLKIIAEGTSTTARSFYTQGPGVIGSVISNNGTTFYHYDRLGTLIATSNEYGEVSETFPTSDAFSGGAIFTGKQFDGDAGLYYFNARWYDPTTGRFVSQDILEETGYSLYSYAYGNPVALIDPSGRSACTIITLKGLSFKKCNRNAAEKKRGCIATCNALQLESITNNYEGTYGKCPEPPECWVLICLPPIRITVPKNTRFTPIPISIDGCWCDCTLQKDLVITVQFCFYVKKG